MLGSHRFNRWAEKLLRDPPSLYHPWNVEIREGGHGTGFHPTIDTVSSIGAFQRIADAGEREIKSSTLWQWAGAKSARNISPRMNADERR